MDETIRPAAKKSRVQRVLAGLIFGIGLVLMIGKIHFDSEPGALPLAMVLIGTVWFLVARARARSRHT